MSAECPLCESGLACEVHDTYRLAYAPPGAIDWNEQAAFANPTIEQMTALEKAWINAPPGHRLEVVAVKAAELGVEIVSMSRHRPTEGAP